MVGNESVLQMSAKSHDIPESVDLSEVVLVCELPPCKTIIRRSSLNSAGVLVN